MDLRIRHAFLGLVVAVAAACAGLEMPKPPDGPALWVIEHGDARMWLFGTVHQLPPEGAPNPVGRRAFSRIRNPVPDAPWRTRELRNAVRSSHTMVLEAVAATGRNELKALSREIGAPSTEGPWHAGLSESDRDRVRQALELRRISPESAAELGKLQVMLLLISLPTLEQDRFSPGVDAWVLQEGRELGLRLVGLETAESRLELIREQFKSYDSAGRRELLMAYHDGAHDTLDTVRKIYNEWANGNVEILEASVNWLAIQHPEVYETFFTRRNHLWVEQLLEFLGDGRDTFVAVGAGHLVGPDNLIALLTQHGHEARRVQ